MQKWDHTANLNVGGISVYWMNAGVGEIISELSVNCPCCDTPDCFFDCDGSKAEDSPETERDAVERHSINAAYDGMESIILAHAIVGIDIESPAYQTGVSTALEAIENAFVA